MTDQDAVLYDLPPQPYPITEVHIWIGIHADGREAMLSTDMPMAFGTRHTPLISTKREVAEGLWVLARRIQLAAMHRADRLIRIELRTFKVAP